MFIRYDRIHERDGQTDTAWWLRSRLHRAAKSNIWIMNWKATMYSTEIKYITSLDVLVPVGVATGSTAI